MFKLFKLNNFKNLEHKSLIYLLFVILISFSIFVPNFLSLATFKSFMSQLPLLGLLSLAMAIPMLTGGLNLAIIATTNSSALLMIWIFNNFIQNNSSLSFILIIILLALFSAILLCLIIGLITGVLVAYLNIHPILITLGTKSLIDGICIYLTRGMTLSGVPDILIKIGNLNILGLPFIFILLIITAIIIGLILSKTAFGISCAMIGSNIEATHYSTIDTKKVLIGVYILSSLICFIASLAILITFNSASSDYAQSYLLITVLANVLGGFDPFGGFGTALGLMLSLSILQFISTGFNQIGLSSYLTTAIWGGVLIFTVMFKNIDLKKLLKKSF